MNQELRFGAKTILYTLKFEQRKLMNIQVHPDQTVVVKAPLQAKEEEIEKKLKAKAPWILKQIDYFASFHPRTPQRRYISGETHLYLGRQYQLKVIEAETNSVKLFSGRLWVYTTQKEPSIVQRQLDAWYMERAQIIIHEIANEVMPRFRKHKVSTPIIILRKMQKRWGSCTANGKVSFNTDLIKAPKSCIEYVVMHELCHLVHYHHKRSFYELLYRMLPDWETRKTRLEHLLA